MAVFEYQALAPNGKKTKGVIDSESERAARNKLKQQGLFLTSIKETRSRDRGRTFEPRLDFFSDRKVPAAQIGIATRQLATLVGAGMPLVESLRALGEQLDHPRLKTVFAEICTMVNEGSTFADAIKQYPRVFPRIYPNMIASAEASGTLELVLERLADLLEAQAQLRRQLFAALAYPVLMLVLCVGVVILLLLVVVPQLTEIFANQGGILPLPTRIVITMSDYIQSYWFLLLGVAIALPIGVTKYINTKNGREKFDKLKLSLPVIGQMNQKAAAARFSRTLGTMLASGVELLTSLGIVKNIIGNVILEQAISNTREGVKEGKSLAKELEQTDSFPRLLIHMTAIGEKTGALESMLLRAAKNYESEVDAQISALTAILNPILILFLAGIVGLILVSVLLPMLEMTSLAG